MGRFSRDLAREQRFPPGVACFRCGWTDARALQRRHGKVVCYKCDRVLRGEAPTEWHHVGGRLSDGQANPFGRVVQVDANLHRILSDRQESRPRDLKRPRITTEERERWRAYFPSREEQKSQRTFYERFVARLYSDPDLARVYQATRTDEDRRTFFLTLRKDPEFAGPDVAWFFDGFEPSEEETMPPSPLYARIEQEKLRFETLFAFDEADLLDVVGGDIVMAREQRRAGIENWHRLDAQSGAVEGVTSPPTERRVSRRERRIIVTPTGDLDVIRIPWAFSAGLPTVDHWLFAVRMALASGDPSLVDAFADVAVLDARHRPHRLGTDLALLRELVDQGALPLDQSWTFEALAPITLPSAKGWVALIPRHPVEERFCHDFRATYDAAIQTGDTSALARYRGKTARGTLVGNGPVSLRLCTSLDKLKVLYRSSEGGSHS